MLVCSNVRVGYSRTDVIRGLDVSVAPGQITALLGVNGAGKTSLVRALAGSLQLRDGKIQINGESYTSWSTGTAVRHGVVLVPEGRHVFDALTVRDNLVLGAFTYRGQRALVAEQLESVLTLFPALASRLGEFAGVLSGGQQQMVAIGRGLMARPKFLLLDEPSLGLSPLIVRDIFAAIGELRTGGVGVLLAEQNGRAALELAHDAYVLEHGQITMHLPAREVLEDSEVVSRFLGTKNAVTLKDRGLFDRIAASSSSR